MAKKKYVSVSAILRCSQVSATTTFVKKDNIVKIDNIEIATENNTEIKPFSEDCQKGGCLSFGKGGKPCTPKLKKWKSEATKRKISGEHPLLEDSTTECETIPGSIVAIEDPKQNTVFYDYEALMTLEAIDKLSEMLAFRLNQYKDDLDKFNACFEKYFGKGHSPKDKAKIVERMRRNQNLLSDFRNKDGSLKERHFKYESMSSSTYAYVYPNDKGHVIYINSVRFDNGSLKLNGFDSLPGTLAHETAHFEDIGDTDDYHFKKGDIKLVDEIFEGDSNYHVIDGAWYYKNKDGKNERARAYGSLAIYLSKYKPNEALNNSDNYEFFLESGEDCITRP